MYSRYQAFILILASSLLVLIFYTNFPITRKSLIGGNNNEQWNLIVTGDVMLGRTVMIKSLDSNDPIYPFRKVSEKLRETDLVFVNLENPVVEKCPRHTDGFKFCADPKMVEGLVYAGVDVVSLANNHSLNYGVKGLEETKKILKQNNIAYTDHDLVIKEINGTKVGLIGINLVDEALNEVNLKLIKESKQKVDILVVAPHWGIEYKDRSNNTQKKYAKEIVDSGADIIVGSHPHWVQDMEYINKKPVYYSLGNFIFDQMWSEETKKGMAVEFVFKGKSLVGEEKLPVYMKDWAQPQWVNN